MPSVNLSPLFNGQTMFGPTGLPLAGGKLYTYQAGSSSPWPTYTDVNGNIANTNPIILGSDAKLPNELWLQSGYGYKFVLNDANDVLVNTYDNIFGILSQIPTTSPAVPSGCILIWSGATGAIPSGFVICDGTNGTPDLRDKFVIGAGNAYSVGQTGGSADAIVVSHTHTASSATGYASISVSTTSTQHSHGLPTYMGPWNSVNNDATVGGGTVTGTLFAGQNTGDMSANQTHTHTASDAGHTHSISVTSAGSSGTNANLPPYYALAFVMKT